jgi:GNAT superfamily N-acetyltransferase
MGRGDEFFAEVGNGPYKYHVIPPDDEKGYKGFVNVYHPDEGNRPIGSLEIRNRDKEPINGEHHREVHFDVDKAHQRKGIATRMYRLAEAYGPLRHAPVRSDDGENFANSVGGYKPPRVNLDELQIRGRVGS